MECGARSIVETCVVEASIPVVPARVVGVVEWRRESSSSVVMEEAMRRYVVVFGARMAG